MLTVEEVSPDIRKVVWAWIKDSHDRHDVLQEALIIAWKAIDDGIEDRAILRGKTRSYCRQFLSKRGRTFTGSQNYGSVDGREEPAAALKREKIRTYIRDFRELHGRKPTDSETSRGLGMPLGSVRTHMARLYLFSGALKKEDVTLLSADKNIGDGQGTEELNIIDQYRYEDAQTDVIDLEIAVNEAMDRVLTDIEKTVIRRNIFEDEILNQMGHTGGLPSTRMVKLHKKNAFAKLRPELEEFVS